MISEAYIMKHFNVDATILGNLFGLKLGKGASINIAYDGRISSTDLKENLP